MFWSTAWGGAWNVHARSLQDGPPRSLWPIQGKRWRIPGTYKGYLIVAFVGDDVGDEAPSHGGLLDVVGQNFRRLIWAGEKTEEEKGVSQVKSL